MNTSCLSLKLMLKCTLECKNFITPIIGFIYDRIKKYYMETGYAP